MNPKSTALMVEMAFYPESSRQRAKESWTKTKLGTLEFSEALDFLSKLTGNQCKLMYRGNEGKQLVLGIRQVRDMIRKSIGGLRQKHPENSFSENLRIERDNFERDLTEFEDKTSENPHIEVSIRQAQERLERYPLLIDFCNDRLATARSTHRARWAELLHEIADALERTSDCRTRAAMIGIVTRQPRKRVAEACKVSVKEIRNREALAQSLLREAVIPER